MLLTAAQLCSITHCVLAPCLCQLQLQRPACLTLSVRVQDWSKCVDTEREEGRDFTEECSTVVNRGLLSCLVQRLQEAGSTRATFCRLLVLHLYWIAHRAACQGLCCLAGTTKLHCQSRK